MRLTNLHCIVTTVNKAVRTQLSWYQERSRIKEPYGQSTAEIRKTELDKKTERDKKSERDIED